jgi:Domain of unknown function (DUF4334)/GXWXG protein
MTEAAREQFAEFKRRTGRIPDAELDGFWETLRPAGIGDMLGEWKGGEFVTGHRANGRLEKGRWFGKTFVSATDVKPLICLDEHGNKYSDTDWMKGEASLWIEEFRGELVATMVYDGVPIHDHFKQIDQSTMMGIMNGKAALDNGRHLYFYLERV